MGANLLRVVLKPLHAHHSRFLTFASDNDHVEIGRSSKREAKNLLPAVDNAWFDSRVMSRNHARLSVSLEKGALFIRDGGSMHGTKVNETKIAPEQEVEIHNGDLLTFGSDVTRGAETFPPLIVTCQFHWADSSIPRPKLNQSINTFTVPDDDDDTDVIEIVHDSVPANTVSLKNDDGSEKYSDLENRESIENSTPVTSPSSKELNSGSESRSTKVQLEVLDDGSDHSNGTSHSPIVLDQEEPLATPRMTPPSVLNTLGEPHENSSTADDDVMDREDRAPSMPSSPVEDYINEIEIEYSDEDDGMSNYDDDYDASETGSNGLGLNDEGSGIDDQSDGACSHIDHMNGEETDGRLPLTNDSAPVSPAADEGRDASVDDAGSILQRLHGRYARESSKPSLFESILSPPKPEAASISTLQPNDMPSAIRLSSLYNLSSSGWTHQTLSEEGYAREGTQQMKSQYPQNEPQLGPRLGSYEHTNNASPVNGGTFTAENPWRQESQQFEKRQDPEQSGVPATSVLDSPRGDCEPNTHTSIADNGLPLKRKSDEMEPDEPLSYPDSAALYTFDANPTPLDDDSSKETYSQDAQPQLSPSNFNSSTQASGMHTIIDEVPAPAPEEERSSKRVKLSEKVHGEEHREKRGGGFVSHAATAIAGALVGGVGTVALLASLPPDYFS